MFTVVLTLCANVYFCLLLQAYHPHWTFKHMFRGLEALLAGTLPTWGEPGAMLSSGQAFICSS